MKLPASGLARALLAVAATLLVLFVAAWIALIVVLPPAKVRTHVSAQLSRTLAREVRFADASVGLWPPVRLTVRDLAIAEPGGFDEGTSIAAPSIHLRLDPFALLGRRVVLRRLDLDRPAVHFVTYADGTTNFDGFAAPPGAEGGGPAGEADLPMDVAIDVLRVKGGRLLMDDIAADRRTSVSIDSKLGLAVLRGGQRIALDGETTLSELRLGPLAATRLADLKSGLAALEWRIEHRGAFDAEAKRLALERLVLRLGRTELTASGVIDDPGPKARLALHARATDVDLGAVLGYLAEADARALNGISGSGKLGFDLHVVGALGPDKLPALTGTLAVEEGAFRYAGAPAGVTALAFRTRFAPDSLLVSGLTARVADQPVRGQLLATRLRDPLVRFALNGKLDLAAIAPLVSPPGVKLAGIAAVEVTGRGPAKQPAAMSIDGRAALAGVRIEAPGLPKPVESVQGKISFSGTQARVTGLSAKAGASSFTLDATVAGPLAIMAKPGEKPPATANFTLRSPYLDLAELLPVTPGSPIAPNARGGGAVAIARLKKDKLDVTNVRARVALEPGVVGVPDFSFDGYGGRVAGEARFDVTDPAKPAYAVKARVDSARADAILSVWTPIRGVLDGALSTTLDLSGRGTTPQEIAKTLTAVGLASLTKGGIGPAATLDAIATKTGVGEFKKLRFNSARVPFRVQDGKVVTDDVSLAGSTGEWKLAGAVGFDGALDYAVSVTVAPEIVSRLGANAALAAGALADDQGRVLLDLKVGGSVKRPRVSLDSKATGDRIAGRLSSSLKEQGKKIERDLLDAYTRKLTGDTTVTDSARAAARKDVVNDLKKIKGRDLLKRLFGGGTTDTTKP